jgi:VCBS repeat-containing protein
LTISLDNDGDGLTDSADPDCQAVANTPPVANPDSYSTPVNTALNVGAPGVLGNDTDTNGDSLTAVKVTDPAHGTVTLNANGSFTYTPTAGYSGPDSFTYKANDGTADGNTATVSITVNAAAGAMSVTPAGGMSSSGAPGGPFSPSSQQYTLTNTGGTSINWTASKTQTWVTLSSAGGTLAAGATDNVTVSINSGANSLVAGPYNDTVTFTNSTNGTGNTTRTVSLTVNAAPDTTPPIVSPPTSPDNNATGVAVGTNVTATFSEPILSGSVTATSFILSDGVDNVVGTFSVNGAIVTFDPSAPLLDNTTYTATLTTAVTDLAGNPLATNYSWTFTTSASSPAPILPLESSGGGGCAMAGTSGDIKELAGTYGFLILAALGMAIRRRVKRKEK